MSEHPPPNGPDGTDDAEVDDRLEELADLEIEPRRGFVARLLRRIERRSLGNQVIMVSWELPKMVLIEFLKIAFELCSPSKGERK